MAIAVIAFIIAFLLLSKAGERAVRSLLKIVMLFSVSEYLVAFVLMSFATTIPELFVGVSSALAGVPGFSFGNALGANFIHLTLVMGIITLANGGLEIESKISKRNFWIVLVLSFLPILTAYDGVISRTDGITLLVSFGFYLVRMFGERRYFSGVVNNLKMDPEGFKRMVHSVSVFMITVATLLVASWLLIWSGKTIALGAGISPFTFGLIFIAIGTTLPELIFGIKANALKHSSLTIGNTIGAIAFNALFITGIVAIIHPITVAFADVALVTVFLALAFTLFNIFVYTKSRISRREAFILIGVYGLFLLIGNIL